MRETTQLYRELYDDERLSHEIASTDSLISDGDSGEKGWSGSRRSRSSSAFQRWRWLIDAGLVILVLGLLVDNTWQRRKDAGQQEIAGDITGFAPKSESN